MRFVPFFLLAVSAAAAAAPPARVNVDRVKPRYRSFSGNQPACLSDGSACKLDYYGGRVIPNAKVYLVKWGSSTNVSTPNMADFFAKATNSTYLDWLNEYNTNIDTTDTVLGPNPAVHGTDQFIGRGVFGGTTTITPSLNTGVHLDDTDVIDELIAQLAKGTLPQPDDNALYMVYFPLGTDISQRGAVSCQVFCAYHGTFSLGGKSIYYGVMPSQESGSGCELGCGGLDATSSHELVEAITDAEVALADSNGPPLGWYDNTNNAGEIADICDAAPYVTIPGTTYSVQKLLSNLAYSADHNNGCVASRSAANDFTVAFNATSTPTAASVTAGGSTLVVPIATTFTGTPLTLSLTKSGLPPGVTATFDSTSITAGNGTNLNITAAAGATNVKDAVIQVKACTGGSCPTGASASLVHTAGLLLQVTGGVAASDFLLSVTPATQTVTRGNDATYTVSTTATGTPGTINLSISGGSAGLPAGATSASFSPTSISGTGSSTLTVHTTSGADVAAPASFYIVAAGTTVTHMIPARIGLGSGAVTADYTLSITPASGSVPRGGTKSYVVTSHTVAGSPTGIALTVTGLPSGVTGAFSPASIGGSANSTLTLTAGSGAPLSSATTFTVHGLDSNSTARTVTSAVTVVSANDFSISLSPSTLIMQRGTSGTIQVSTSSLSGTAETVTLSATGLPSGVSGTFNPTSGSAGFTSTLTLSSTSSATITSSGSVTVTGTATSATHGTVLSLSVVDPPTAAIAEPTTGDIVTGVVEIDATGAAGAGATLQKIEILVDGTVIASPTASPAQTFWDTTAGNDGPHVITARTVDSGGSTTSSPVNVTVQNTKPPDAGGCGTAGAGVSALLGLLTMLRRRRVT